MVTRQLKGLFAALAVAVPLVFASGAGAVVQIPIEFGPIEPLPQEYEFGTPDVRAEVPFTIRAYPQGVEGPATYAWSIRAWQWQSTPGGHWNSTASGEPESCSVSTGARPEVTLSLPPGSYEVGICVNESGDPNAGNSYWAYCHHELNVVPAGSQARFSITKPSSPTIEEFLERGTQVVARWNRPVRTSYSAVLSVNFGGRETREYPLKFRSGRQALKRTLSSDKAKIDVVVAQPGPDSPARRVLKRALKAKAHISASIDLKTDVTKDPLWSGLENLFDNGVGVTLSRLRLPAA